MANGTAPITRFYSFTQDKSEVEGDLGDDDAYVIATVMGGHLSSENSPEGKFGKSFSRADLMWNNRLGEERGVVYRGCVGVYGKGGYHHATF